ncbi:RNA polymerase sigma factor [Romboutsia weinsteinii]|uniref:RNA polymerase sigma factor n=1 Tax=Romboutsia weinsteinii TaxID=2020949 RepID=A0A371J9A9_9FIRM|nr:RNA polymerase sigma factor [Romboutsia weinsteinii]RDY29350.1 RNA polymerase sigma factor [Romboutsia weinsteinii]
MDKDLRLIKKIIKKNDKESANELISIYYKEVYVYVYKQVSDKETSLDLTQEIFISVLKSIHNFDKGKSSFRTWLYKISTNKLVDYYRSKSYRYSSMQESIEEKEISDKDDFVVNLEQKEDVDKIQQVVNKLDTQYQEIFRLKIFLEATFLEISEILQIPESTVKTKYYSIIKRVKKEFNII